MLYTSLEGRTQAPEPACPDPSPPPFDQSFGAHLDSHYTFYGYTTRQGYCLHASSLCSPLIWRLGLRANFLSGPDLNLFSTQNLPPHLLPFFAYKDTVVYVPPGCGPSNSFKLFDSIYREWYPTRDRTVFHNGVYKGCGAAFFSSTIRVEFESPTPSLVSQLGLVIRWHVALSRCLHELLPQFRYLQEAGTTLVRAGLTQEERQSVPDTRAHAIYTPFLRHTITECFLWLGKDWEQSGMSLVVLGEDMLRGIVSGEYKGLEREIDVEEQLKKVTKTMKSKGEGDFGDNVDEELEAAMNHVSVWKDKLQDVMRAVVGGDETRKIGKRDYSFMLEEWLGQGVNVGVDGKPMSDTAVQAPVSTS